MGDLAVRKLLPALYRSDRDGESPDQTRVDARRLFNIGDQKVTTLGTDTDLRWPLKAPRERDDRADDDHRTSADPK